MRPTYPLTCFLLDSSNGESTVMQRRGASGRIRTYDVGVFSDHTVTLTHQLITRATVDEVMDFWRRNRGQQFNVESAVGEYWIGSFLGRPRRTHVDGDWHDLVVEMVRYEPEEEVPWH